ncbi:MAG: putative porin [Candidatus Krumholzibacteriota bacterium]|nr:putative porin [Candidatus Krumholzibacteriota bacterium]
MKRAILFVLIGSFLAAGAAQAGEWYDKVKIKGDFRQRHDLIQDESKDVDRNRWRIRARLELGATVTDDWSVGIRLASGSDDPVSTNQSMTDGASTKGFGLDLAYFDFHPGLIDGLHIVGGKMKLPFNTVQKTELIWDGDWNPEGAAVTYEAKIDERVALFVNGAFFYLEERSSDDDSWMAGGQAGIRITPADGMRLVVAGGYYDYQAFEGYAGMYDPGDLFGNTGIDDDGDMLYATDYNVAEFQAEFGVKLEKLAFAVYGDFVRNIEADSLDTAYLFGASVQHGKDKGHVKVYANYREVEDDAVVGEFTDSDFIGGGTNGNGFEIGAGYGIAKKVDLALSFFVNNKGIDEEIDFKRLLVDLVLKF